MNKDKYDSFSQCQLHKTSLYLAHFSVSSLHTRGSLLHQQICQKFRPTLFIYLQENSIFKTLPDRHFHTQRKQWGFCMEGLLPASEARTALQPTRLQSIPENQIRLGSVRFRDISQWQAITQIFMSSFFVIEQ